MGVGSAGSSGSGRSGSSSSAGGGRSASGAGAGRGSTGTGRSASGTGTGRGATGTGRGTTGTGRSGTGKTATGHSGASSFSGARGATAGRAPGSLGLGSRGKSVSSLQNSLRAAGFDPGKADGVFGAKTQSALRGFQQSKGLKADGVAGRQTLGALSGRDSFQAARTVSQPAAQLAAAAQAAGPIKGLPTTGNAFMDRIAADAITSQRRTGVPASVTMAQAALESEWGKSGLSKRANNYFGIKGQGPAGSVTMRTREEVKGKSTYVNAPFRSYTSPAQSFEDHGRFLTGNRRYGTAMQHTDDPHRFAKEIARAGYATDSKYAAKLSGMINKYGLERFDQVARDN